jgi:hypothetical protein
MPGSWPYSPGCARAQTSIQCGGEATLTQIWIDTSIALQAKPERRSRAGSDLTGYEPSIVKV